MPHIRNSSRPITGGPSKYELKLALFDRTYTCPRPVKFRIGKALEHIINVSSVQIEDGSGESFNIIGQGPDFRGHYKICYRTDIREGTIRRLTDQELTSMSA